jgi:hypothetical protein
MGNTSYREKAHSPHPNGAGHFRGTPLSVLAPMTSIRPASRSRSRARHNPLQKVPRSAEEQGLLTPGAFRFQWSTSVGDFPGSPSSCPSHYRRAFGYYAASALCPARWHVRVPCGSSSCRVPQFRVSAFAQPVACLLDAGCLVEEPSLMCKQAGTYTVTILVKCLSRFHSSDFTTLPTQYA